MHNYVYDRAEILVCDPVVSHRVATRSALYSMGFRNIESVSTLRDFSASLKKRPPDVALCDFQAGNELCSIIQELRQDPDSLNPFVVVLITAWTMTADLTHRISNSGVDGLLLRPFSTAVLKQRIDAFISNRKRFVITSDYIGPDRRSSENRPTTAALLAPPTSPRWTAGAQSPTGAAETFATDFRAVCTQMNLEKIKCDTVKICILGKLLAEATAEEIDHDETIAHIFMLLTAIEQRARTTEHVEVGRQLAPLRELAAKLRNQDNYSASLSSFGKGAIELARVFQAHKTSKELLDEVTATLAVIRAHRKKEIALFGSERTTEPGPEKVGAERVASGA